MKRRTVLPKEGHMESLPEKLIYITFPDDRNVNLFLLSVSFDILLLLIYTLIGLGSAVKNLPRILPLGLLSVLLCSANSNVNIA